MRFANLFHGVKSFLGKLFESQTWEEQVSKDITLAAPALQLIVAETAGEENAAEVARVVAEVGNDLNTVATIVAGVKGSIQSNDLAKVRALLDTVKANLGSILSAGHIKDAETVQKITAIVNGVVSELDAVLQILPAYTA